MYVIDTTDAHGFPVCPMCDIQMEREGEFCSAAHYQEFHEIVFDLDIPMIEMSAYLDLEEQPWYGVDHG